MVRRIAPVHGRRLWALVAACTLTPSPASAALGDPDPGYGAGGLAVSPAPLSPRDAHLDAAGRAVFAGFVQDSSRAPAGGLERLDARGAPDPGFGVTIESAQRSIQFAPAPGGEWLVASVDVEGGLFLTRVTADGATPSGEIAAGSGHLSVSDLVVLGDGRAVVTGTTEQGQMFVSRFTAALAPDGPRAVLRAAVPRALDVDAFGRAVVTAEDEVGGFVTRVEPGGAVDGTFANAGVRRITGVAHAVRVLGTGRILIAGQAPQGATLARLTPEGTPEDGFGGTYRDQGARFDDLLVDAVGGIYAAGTTDDRWLLHRFDDRGLPDVTLRPDGFREMQAGLGLAVGLDAQERPHVLGSTGEQRPAAARLLANAAPTAAIAGPARVPLGGRAIFDAAGSVDPERALRRFEWDLDGDGAFETDTASNPSVAHVFRTAGERRVSVRVSDHRGLQSAATHTFQVDPSPGPAPVLGEAFLAEPVRGRVLVRRPGASRFVRLMAGEQIPEGSIVDTRRGRVRIVAARDLAGATDSAEFYLGRFRLSQTDGAAPYTTLALHGGDFSGCGPARPRLRAPIAETAARRRKRVVRRLWGDGHGRFRTKGRYAAATVRGTKWQTIDRCDGVGLEVVRGAVDFRDLLRATRARRVRAGRTDFVPSKRNP